MQCEESPCFLLVVRLCKVEGDCTVRTDSNQLVEREHGDGESNADCDKVIALLRATYLLRAYLECGCVSPWVGNDQQEDDGGQLEEPIDEKDPKVGFDQA